MTRDDDSVFEAMIIAASGPSATPKARENLANRMWPYLARYAFERCGDRDDAGDAALQVVERLRSGELLKGFEPRAPLVPAFVGFLNSAIGHAVSHVLRSHRAEKRGRGKNVAYLDDTTEAPEIGPYETAEAREAIEAALARLTAEQREVAAELLLGGDAPEVARILGITPARAKRVCETARVAMRAEHRLPAVDDPNTRRCSVCEEVKPLSEFSPKGGGLLESRCRPCNKERAAQKRQRDPEAGRKAAREYAARKRAAQRLSKAATSLADQLATHE